AAGPLGSAELGHHGLGDVEVRVDVLDVVEILERLDEREHLARLTALDRHGRLRHHRELGGEHRDPRLRDAVPHRREGGGLGRDLPRALGVPEIVGAGLERQLEQPLLVRRRLLLDLDEPLAREHPRYAPALAQAAAVAGERVADLLRGAVAVVGQALDEQRHPARPVPLVGDLLVLGAALELTRSALDRALDVLNRNREAPGLLDRGGERHVGLGVAAPALAGRHLHGPKQLGELVAALGVEGALLSLDRRPLGMPGHRSPLPEDVLVQPRLPDQLGVERRRHEVALLEDDRMSLVRRQDAHARSDLLHDRRTVASKTPKSGSPPSTRAANTIIPAQVPRIGMPARARSTPGPTRFALRASLPIVVDSPPGITSTSTRSRSSGVRTSTGDAPSSASTAACSRTSPWSARTPAFMRLRYQPRVWRSCSSPSSLMSI